MKLVTVLFLLFLCTQCDILSDFLEELENAGNSASDVPDSIRSAYSNNYDRP